MNDPISWRESDEHALLPKWKNRDLTTETY